MKSVLEFQFPFYDQIFAQKRQPFGFAEIAELLSFLSPLKFLPARLFFLRPCFSTLNREREQLQLLWEEQLFRRQLQRLLLLLLFLLEEQEEREEQEQEEQELLLLLP